MPAWIAPAIMAAGSWLGGLFDSNSQQETNEQNQQFAREMYAQQRADNLSMWHTQNDYNSPQKQMQRLRESGLNPNLVYGNGSAVNTASPVANATPNVPQRIAPKIGAAISGATDSIASYYDLQAKEASIDNMRAQNTLLKNQAILQAVQAENANFDIDLKKALRDNTINTANWKFDLLKNQTNSVGEDVDRKARFNKILEETEGSKIKAENLRPEYIRAQMQNILSGTQLRQAELELKRLETNLRKNGISPSDPIYLRVIGQWANKLGFTIQP